MKRSTGDIIGLIIVTIGAVVVLFTFSIGRRSTSVGISGEEGNTASAIPKAPVSVILARPEPIEITHVETGKLRAMDTYQLAFELSGRVAALGRNPSGAILDEGDRVTVGQELAYLDDEIYRADLEQAQATLTEADDRRQRALETEGRGRGIMSADELGERIANYARAVAAQRRAKENIDNCVLRSPVDGVVSRRHAKPGESVGAHEIVFEILETDPIILVIGVPESQVLSIRKGQPARVELNATDIYGNRRPAMIGEVHHVSSAGNPVTGQFDVEIRLSNSDYQLRPALVAKGTIIIDQIEGFRLPPASVVYRNDEAFIFAVDDNFQAVRFPLASKIDQGDSVIVTDLPVGFRNVVVRGQRRLVDGREVEIVPLDDVQTKEALQPDISIRTGGGTAGLQ